MKPLFVVTLLVAAMSALAGSSDHDVSGPLPSSEATRRPAVLSCAVGDVVCGGVVKGELGVTGCTLDDGTYVDSYEFNGTVNEVVDLTVRPLNPTYREPTISITPPGDDASKPPMVAGGVAGTVRFRLTSSGKWKIDVGSRDLFSSGAYTLETDCQMREGFFAGQCIQQEILCGQTQRWELASRSCRFSTRPDRLYQPSRFFGVAGDVLTLKMVASSFAPRIGIYDFDRGGDPLQRSIAVGSDTAEMTFTVPNTGLYRIAATSTEDGGVGPYTLTVNCAKSGCVSPSIMNQPLDVRVDYGQTATLTLDVHHLGPVQYSWYEFTDFPLLRATTSTPQWQTGPITAVDSYYYVTASSPCGSRSSEMIHVGVKPDRRRAARH